MCVVTTIGYALSIGKSDAQFLVGLFEMRDPAA